MVGDAVGLARSMSAMMLAISRCILTSARTASPRERWPRVAARARAAAGAGVPATADPACVSPAA